MCPFEVCITVGDVYACVRMRVCVCVCDENEQKLKAGRYLVYREGNVTIDLLESTREKP